MQSQILKSASLHPREFAEGLVKDSNGHLVQLLYKTGKAYKYDSETLQQASDTLPCSPCQPSLALYQPWTVQPWDHRAEKGTEGGGGGRFSNRGSPHWQWQ